MIETMQKRINEIKQQDRKSYYEIANEIGISESTLYNLMTRDKLFTPAEQKIIAYLKSYLTKDEQLEAYRLDNEKLKAENKILKKVAFQSQHAAIHINQQVEKYEERIKVLEKDLVDWQDAYKELEKAHDKIQGAYQDDHCDLLKYKQTLQEIKAIAKTCLSGVDCTECPFTNECKTDYEIEALGVCQMILQKITKVEEE